MYRSEAGPHTRNAAENHPTLSRDRTPGGRTNHDVHWALVRAEALGYSGRGRHTLPERPVAHLQLLVCDTAQKNRKGATGCYTRLLGCGAARGAPARVLAVARELRAAVGGLRVGRHTYLLMVSPLTWGRRYAAATTWARCVAWTTWRRGGTATAQHISPWT